MSQNLQLQKSLRSRYTRIRHRNRLTTTNPRLASRLPGLSNFLAAQAPRADASPLRLKFPDQTTPIFQPGVSPAGLYWKVGDKFTMDGGQVSTIDAVGIVLEVEERASDLMEYTGNAIEADTVTIGSTVYTYLGDPTVPFSVLTGATIADSMNNLIAAINGDAGEGTLYGPGTTPHPDVTANINTAVVMRAIAKVPGEDAFSITTDATGNMGWWEGNLLNGQVLAVGLIDQGEYTTLPGAEAAAVPYQLENGRVNEPFDLAIDADVGTGVVAGVTGEELLDGLKGQTNVAGDTTVITRARHFLTPRQTDDTYLDNGVPVV